MTEDVLTLDIESVGLYSLMWTPTGGGGAVGYTKQDGVLTAQQGTGDIPDSLALAAGFCYTEGLIRVLSDIESMSVCPERADVVSIRLASPEAAAVSRRNVVVNSSCGVCGGREQLEAATTSSIPACTGAMTMTIADLGRIRSRLQAEQDVFRRTGGTHGAAIFDTTLSVTTVAEDLGRHNALDKVIGRRLLGGQSLAGCGAFISSRISYEMVAKAVRAGFQVVAAISAPSSMAIDLAQRRGITLCGFVRENRATIYTHPHRIVVSAD